MAEGAAPDPHRVEIPGGLEVVSDVAGSETISTVLGVGSTTNENQVGVARIGDLALDGPLGIESSQAAKALYDAMKTPAVDGTGFHFKTSGPLSCRNIDSVGPDVSPYSCTIGNLLEVAHGFDGTRTTLTFQSGTIAAIRDALAPESVTANGFAVSGSLSGTTAPGGGPDHVSSVDGIQAFLPPVPTSPFTARLGGWDFPDSAHVMPGNAAAKVFSAMTRAKETFDPGQRLTTRTSAGGRLVCTRAVEKLDLYSCSISNVAWQSIAEGAASKAGFCATP
jgi:hypothetical protein